VDVWAWVADAQTELRDAGHTRLADIMDEVSSLTAHGHHDQVEAVVPEGVALARSIDHPWVEVFLRHWLAQSRILHRCDVRDMDEVVRLLDFAHGERTASCPQSVCATQDFCSAYGVLDGPGFGAERIAASAEALARIDPTWPCFGCISMEHADALLDLGRYEEAESFCARQIRAGRRVSMTEVKLARADALIRLGRLPEARGLLEKLKSGTEMQSLQTDHALLKSRLYALLGCIDDAIKVLPRADELEPGDFVKFCWSAALLSDARPEFNDAALGAALRRFCSVLRANGSLHNHASVAVAAAKFALGRGRPALASLHLADAATIFPQLRNPAALQRQHAEISAAVSPPSTPLDPIAALEALGDDAELDLDTLTAAQRAHPDNEPLTLALSRALRALGFTKIARGILDAFVRGHPGAHEVWDELMRLLVLDGDEAGLRSMAALVPEAMRATAQFRLGRLFIQRESWAEAAQSFEAARALESEPDHATLANLADAYRHLGRLDESLALLDELAREPEQTAYDWDRMVVATLLERHEIVRDSARRLGFTFAGEGPIDEPFAYCTVKRADSMGRDEALRALRINPVVARIIAMQDPGKPCFYRDEVLYDPAALNQRPDDAEAAKSYVPEFRVIKVLKRGGYRIYDLDGVHPGDERIDALATALGEIGVSLSVRSSDAYQLKPDDQPPVTGVYIFIAVPEATGTDAVYRVLQAAAWNTPITYRGLLSELGLQTELESHQAIADELNL